MYMWHFLVCCLVQSPPFSITARFTFSRSHSKHLCHVPQQTCMPWATAGHGAMGPYVPGKARSCLGTAIAPLAAVL